METLRYQIDLHERADGKWLTHILIIGTDKNYVGGEADTPRQAMELATKLIVRHRTGRAPQAQNDLPGEHC